MLYGAFNAVINYFTGTEVISGFLFPFYVFDQETPGFPFEEIRL